MPEDPLIGFTVDGFRFDSLLGRGAMGAVYKGVQITLDRQVAIKVIAPHLAEDKDYIGRFHREAQTLGRLVHPHVIACHDTARCKGPHGNELVLMVLEFVDGWSLGSLLKKKHRMTARQMLEMHRQAAEGLSAAHRLGIIHRDIKPDNIMITRKGQAKLADFGLAKADDSAMLTQTGAIMGSPAYMSPEACRGEMPMPASDLYSLGCSLFHGLTGTTPYRASSAIQALHQHIHAPIPRLSELRPDLKMLDSLLEKMLAKRASDRFPDAATFSAALKAAIAVTPVEAPAGISTAKPKLDATIPDGHHATSTIHPVTTEQKKRRWPWIVAAAAGLLILLIVAGGRARNKEPKTITVDTTVYTTLDSVESLLNQKQLSAADALFKSLTTEQLTSDPTLTARVESIQQQLLAPSKPASEKQTKPSPQTRLAEAEDHFAAGRFDQAASTLSSVEPTPEIAARSDGLRQKLGKEFQNRMDRTELVIAAAEMQLSQGQKQEARKTLDSILPPKLRPELYRRYNQIIHATTPPAATATANALIHLKPGDTNFTEPVLPVGFFSLPFGIPSDVDQIVTSRDGRITMTPPPSKNVGKDGCAILIHVNIPCDVRATLICGEERFERPAQRMSALQWDPLIIALDANKPVTAVELHATSTTTDTRIVMHTAGAVIAIGRPATATSLNLIPGGLQPLPTAASLRPDNDNDYRFFLMRMLRSHNSLATLDTIAIAHPKGTEKLSEQLFNAAYPLLPMSDNQAATTVFTYDSPESLKSAFTQSSGKADILFVIVDTAKMPTKETANTIAEQCKSAAYNGTLTVLVLSHDKTAQLDLMDKWQAYINRVHELMPVVPVIDLSVAQQFVKRHRLPYNGSDTTTNPLFTSCLVGGVQELFARVRLAITLNGGRRHSDDANR